MKLLLPLFFIFSTVLQADVRRVITVTEPPASFINEQQQSDGYVTEIVKALLSESKVTPKIEFIPEARVLNIAKEEADILFFTFSRTKQREDLYHWIAPVLTKDWNVYGLKGITRKLTSLKALKQLAAIGVVRGDVREEWLINNGFSNLYSVTQHKQNVQLLLLGRVPFIAYEKQGIHALSKELNFNFEQFELIYTFNTAASYIAMSKKGTDLKLVENIKRRFQDLTESGAIKNIASKWASRLNQQGYGVSVDTQTGLLKF